MVVKNLYATADDLESHRLRLIALRFTALGSNGNGDSAPIRENRLSVAEPVSGLNRGGFHASTMP